MGKNDRLVGFGINRAYIRDRLPGARRSSDSMSPQYQQHRAAQLEVGEPNSHALLRPIAFCLPDADGRRASEHLGDQEAVARI